MTHTYKRSRKKAEAPPADSLAIGVQTVLASVADQDAVLAAEIASALDPTARLVRIIQMAQLLNPGEIANETICAQLVKPLQPELVAATEAVMQRLKSAPQAASLTVLQRLRHAS